LVTISLLITGIFFLITSIVFAKTKFGLFYNLFIAFIFLYVFIVPVTYTPDLEGYNLFLGNENEVEPFFNFISRSVSTYDQLHKIFTISYIIIMLLYIAKFTNYIFSIAVIYILIVYLFFVTQLRYFMGVFALFLGIYFYYVKKKKIISVSFVIFAMLNHFGLILYLPLLYFFKIPINKVFRKSLAGSLIILISFFCLNLLGSSVFSGIRYGEYFSKNLTSSITGGLFVFFPYFIMFLLVNFLHYTLVSKNPEVLNNKKYNFLYRISIFSIIYILIALTIQVIGHRMIIIGILNPILYCFYCKKYIKKLYKMNLVFISSYVFLIFWSYVLPYNLGIVATIKEINLVLESNLLLKEFY
jgi:hypothetical protein